MRYKICPDCGTHLDFGEVCDCAAKKAPPPVVETEDGIGNQRMITHPEIYHPTGLMSTEVTHG